MTELVTISVQVPADRVADLYAFAAQLHRPTLPVPVTTSAQPWSRGDELLAKKVYDTCTGHARLVLTYLANHPGQKLNGADIAQAVHLANGRMAIAGVVVSISHRCKEVGREMPYTLHYERGSAGAFYVMSDDVAAIFKTATQTAA